MTGCIDIYQTRRTTFETCKYWVRDEDEKTLEEYVYKKTPSGIFSAKEVSAEMHQKNIVANAFMFDESTITIFTTDIIDVKSGDVVEFDGKLWNVVNVQKREKHRQKEFLKTTSKQTYIQLRS